MENKEQLLANFLAFKDIPFGDYKNIITTPKAMEFYAKNTPIDQLQSMFVSAGFEQPETINQASNVLKKVYNELQTIDESNYAGAYKIERDTKELEKTLRELQGVDEEEDEEGQEIDDDSVGGFFDESGIGGSDMEKALEKFNEAIANGTGGDKETTFDELLGKNKGQGESEGQGEGDGEQSQEEGDGQGEGDGEGEGEGDGQGEVDDDGQGEGEGQGQGDGEQSQGDGEGQGQGDGQGEGDGEQSQEYGEQSQSQQQKKEQKQNQQNALLEREIQLCSQEIIVLNEEKEMLEFISERTQEQENRILEINNTVDDLEMQIANMLGAINADVVLGNDVQFPVNKIPRYVSSKTSELVKRINDQIKKRLEDPDYQFKYKLGDKQRRNSLISDRVMDDVTYFAFEKLKNEDALSELYLTKKDIEKIMFEMPLGGDVPEKIVIYSKIDGDTVVIDNAISIDTFIYQMNNLEKDLELVNKENNIKLIFDTIKNELFNKFII